MDILEFSQFSQLSAPSEKGNSLKSIKFEKDKYYTFLETKN